MAKFRAIYTEETIKYLEIIADNEEHAFELLEKYFVDEEDTEEVTLTNEKHNSDYDLVRR